MLPSNSPLETQGVLSTMTFLLADTCKLIHVHVFISILKKKTLAS